MQYTIETQYFPFEVYKKQKNHESFELDGVYLNLNVFLRDRILPEEHRDIKNLNRFFAGVLHNGRRYDIYIKMFSDTRIPSVVKDNLLFDKAWAASLPEVFVPEVRAAFEIYFESKYGTEAGFGFVHIEDSIRRSKSSICTLREYFGGVVGGACPARFVDHVIQEFLITIDRWYAQLSPSSYPHGRLTIDHLWFEKSKVILNHCVHGHPEEKTRDGLKLCQLEQKSDVFDICQVLKSLVNYSLEYQAQHGELLELLARCEKDLAVEQWSVQTFLAKVIISTKMWSMSDNSIFLQHISLASISTIAAAIEVNNMSGLHIAESTLTIEQDPGGRYEDLMVLPEVKQMLATQKHIRIDRLTLRINLPFANNIDRKSDCLDRLYNLRRRVTRVYENVQWGIDYR